MNGRLLLENCSLFRTDGRVRDHMTVVVEEGRIQKVAADAEVRSLPGDWIVHCRGRLVAPSLVDCHTHLVGGQLLPVCGPSLLEDRALRRRKIEALSRVLSPDEVETLTLCALGRALLSGVTSLVDHLEGAADYATAFSAQARAARTLGARLVCSAALSSEGGAEAIESTLRFAEASRSHALVRGALGFHASASMSDAHLQQLGRERERLGVGAVFHLAEDEDDLASTYIGSGGRIVPRLEAAGLLGPGVVGAFGRTLDRADAERLAGSGTLLALSPGRALFEEPQPSGLEALLARDALLGVGTAGAGSLWDEVYAGYAGLLSLSRAGRLMDPDAQLAELVVVGPASLTAALFGIRTGAVEEGSDADLVVFGHLAEEREDGMLPGGLLLQLSRAPVDWVLCAGRVVVRERQLLGHDALELEREAARVLTAVRARVTQ